MQKNVYTHYKDRMTKIGGDSKSLCLGTLSQESACDVGKLLSGRDERINEFTDFLFSDRKKSFTLISKEDKRALLEQLDRQEARESENRPTLAKREEAHRVAKRNAKTLRDELRRELEADILSIKSIKQNCEDIESDTGRNELFIGFPFVFGTLSFLQNNISVKAPLLLFPVRIDITDDETVVLHHDTSEKILINPAFITAYSFIKNTSAYSARIEFDSLSSFNSLEEIIKYLKDYHVKIEHIETKNLFGYSRFKEPYGKNVFSTRYGAVLSHFSITQSIYGDYIMLERKNETNEAIDSLLSKGSNSPYIIKKAKHIFGKIGKLEKTDEATYTIAPLDFHQLEAVRKVGEGKSYVIDTPPFSACSNVAAAMVADAICKKKRVLIVSDKKNSLDTIYNSLATLKDRCAYINDEPTEREGFYRELYARHERALLSKKVDLEALIAAHNAIACEIKEEEKLIEGYFKALSSKHSFGMSMLDMYASSFAISHRSADYMLYSEMQKEPFLMELGYEALSRAVIKIQNAELAADYYEFITKKNIAPVFLHLRAGISTKRQADLLILANSLAGEERAPFPFEKFKYTSDILQDYASMDSVSYFDSLVKQTMRNCSPKKRANPKLKSDIIQQFIDTLTAIREHVKDFEPFKSVLTKAGYNELINKIIYGKNDYVKSLASALSSYERMQQLERSVASCDKTALAVLNFAYKKARDRRHFGEILEKILPLRIYHELILYEEINKEALLSPHSLAEARKKILLLDEKRQKIAKAITDAADSCIYASIFSEKSQNDVYLADISSHDAPLPIRRLLEQHEELITALYPCWLLTPENVSTVLPLKKNLFDLVIFDGASQMFIEEALPAAYRAKTAAVMGDGKQIHTSTEFMRRSLGNDIDAAPISGKIKTESLYDVAAKNLPITKLTYNYGGDGSDFMSFSNRAFYSSEIVVAPHVYRKQKSRPIEMRTVCGGAVDGRCLHEAQEVIDLLTAMSKKKRSSSGIGIITFTKAQRDCIIELLESAMAKSEELSAFIEKEKHRTKFGEDASFFIKTVENAQGCRRDLIILSPALSKDDIKVGTADKDFNIEAAINVSITRARHKFILVTGLSPEAVIEGDGGESGIYEKFLSYVNAAAVGTRSEIKSALSEIGGSSENLIAAHRLYPSISEQIAERLCKMGYTVHFYPGDKHSAISLAVYDEKKDRYLVGIILDEDALAFSSEALEREVYYPQYLTELGWSLLRITAREWWHEPKKVITTIIEAAEYNRSDIKNT